MRLAFWPIEESICIESQSRPSLYYTAKYEIYFQKLIKRDGKEIIEIVLPTSSVMNNSNRGKSNNNESLGKCIFISNKILNKNTFFKIQIII